MEEEAPGPSTMERPGERASWRSFETPPSQLYSAALAGPERERPMQRSVVEYINLSPRHVMHSSQRALVTCRFVPFCPSPSSYSTRI